MPLPDKVEAIKSITVPTTIKQLLNFIGLINYYRDMWKQRSLVLTPLTPLTSKHSKFNWSKESQKTFNTMKKLVSRETLLPYQNFNRTFIIHTDVRKLQLGAILW